MMKKGNNKGFSLIEIIIGIGMLAVIVIPILHTFITSAQINRDSRQVMIQTEVAQTIMEGFAGKTYHDVATISIPALATNTGVSGNAALSSIDGNLFNSAGAYIEYHATPDIENMLTAVSRNAVTWQGSVIMTSSGLSDNSVMASMNQVFAEQLGAKFNAVLGGSSDPGAEGRMFSFWKGDGGRALFIGYGDIHYEGYHFDAVVSFLPTAENPDDKYYAYRILLTLYEYQPGMSVGERCRHVLMTMDGGIMMGRAREAL